METLAFTLRPLHESHRNALEQMLHATDAFREEEIAVALELFGETVGRSALRTSDYEFVGAFDEDAVLAGYACFGPTPGTDATYDLYWIAVHPAYQGCGAGTALLAEIEQRINGRGGRLVVIETSARDGYDATRRFYVARGYDLAARLRDFYAPTDDRVIFTKRLTDSPSSHIRALRSWRP
jgi:ribosomal protein S18 acetylase RimI-like enzyme